MAVRIRLKKLGRRHRPFFRICAMDSRVPRGGKVLEELGTYDPMIPDTDARAILKAERIDYWLGVGALPTEKVGVLIKKYGTDGTHVEKQRAALDTLAQPKAIPDPGEPASKPKPPEPTPDPAVKAAKAEESKAKAPADAATEAPAEDAATEAPPTEEAVAEAPAAEEPAAEESAADDSPAEAVNEDETKEEG